MAEEKSDKITRPKPCCGKWRELEKLGAVIYTVLERYVFNFDAPYQPPATDPINFCPFCAADRRPRT